MDKKSIRDSHKKVKTYKITQNWYQSFRNEPTDLPFWARISSRLIAKVLRKKRHKKRFFIRVFAEKIFFVGCSCANKIAEFLVVKQPLLKHYSPQIAFILLFFLIVHPGLHSRRVPEETATTDEKTQTIPPRSQIYAVENIHLSVQIDRKSATLYRKQQQIVSYPVAVTRVIPNGKFFISRIEKNSHQGIRLFLSSYSGSQNTITIGDYRTRHNFPPHIYIEDDFLEALYPYLRVGTGVNVS